ncbi:hypothetical protein Goshw_009195 [Gossypium schwendimanii]|uniref:Phorbol-ester/DAG-type domain-containing protein n=1 Tax=Gossypium schwendimanii TaxID=34291 RepID=A0A7J9MU74_GOSSC|nr:hypothetical protein [Gossypium schwendimanii]
MYDRAFTCEICKFWLHPECALISHPSHSQHRLQLIYEDKHCCCNGCSGLSRNWLYRCQRCDFNLDLSCASSTTIPTPIDKEINHFCHHHTLTQFNYRKSSAKHEYHRHELILTDFFVEDFSDQYYCDICEQERVPQHPVYCCKKCRFVAHIGCALTEIKDDHGSASSLVGGKGTSIGKLMEQDERNAESKHSLKLLSEIRGKVFSCDGCRDVTAGFACACSMCGFMLDVKCALLRVPKIETQRLKEMEEGRPKSCLFNKAHQLSFFNIKAIFDECCSFCQRYVKGPAYSCSDSDVFLHESCLGFPREMKLQFHPLHPFHSLLDNSSKICHVCKREIWYDICYSCVQCDLQLHASCAKSLKKRLHVECALPPSLKSNLHPCTLKPGFMEDDLGQNYCDICEEERDPEDHEEEIAAEGSSNMALDFPSTSGWAERESVSIDESEEDDQISIDEYSE